MPQVRALVGAVAWAGVALLCSCAAVRARTEPTGAYALRQQVEALRATVRGHRIALITNPTGVDADLNLIADLLRADGGTTITAFFAPEHGLRGNQQAGEAVESFVDPRTGIPVYSLYGESHAPTDEQLRGIDMLVFDMQDVGVRFYTRIWLMTYAMESAARKRIRFVVFDRPNPLGGVGVEGAPNRVDAGIVGRVWPGQRFGIPVRHGMTIGEFARLVNGEWMNPKVDLEVISIPGYTRDMDFEATGRPWVMPSPNMPTLDTARVYPGMCVFEGTNLSEGRGTTLPFEVVGAPFIDGYALAAELNSLGLPGVRARPVSFRPSSGKFARQPCGGIQVHVTDREAFDPIRTALHVLQTIQRKYPDDVRISRYAGILMGVPDLADRIQSERVDAIIAGWQPDLKSFKRLRAKYLLYPAASGD